MEQGCIRQIYGAEGENCKDKKKIRGSEGKITLRKFRCLFLVKCVYKCLCRKRVKEAERKKFHTNK